MPIRRLVYCLHLQRGGAGSDLVVTAFIYCGAPFFDWAVKFVTTFILNGDPNRGLEPAKIADGCDKLYLTDTTWSLTIKSVSEE